MKKGTIALLGSAIAFLIIILLLITGKIETGEEHILGSDALSILKTNYYPEKIFIYIEESAKLSIAKAEDNGDLNKIKFLESFNGYLSKLDWTKNIVYREDDLEIKGDYLIGKSEQEIVLKFENVEYKIKPKFKQKIKFISEGIELSAIDDPIKETSIRLIDDYIKEASNTFSVDEKIIRKIIEKESNFNLSVGCNKAGACGLMQIREIAYNDTKRVYNDENKYTWKVTYSWEDAKSKHRENILTGTAYFKIQYDAFNGDLKLALAAYNWGVGNVNDNCKTKNFEECKNVPPETTKYVKYISERVNSLFS